MMIGQDIMEPKDFLVRVRCDTYNHVSYIKDTLDGFSVQETSFPFICTIFDDASTDGESDVLMNYLQQHFDVEDKSIARKEETEDYVLIFARNKKNTNCFFAVFFLKYNHYSIKKDKFPYSKEWNNAKYTALCEGDDYWTDPLKLQKQVDALESHQQCTISLCRVQSVRKNGSIIKNGLIPRKNRFKEGLVSFDDFCKEELMSGYWCFHTSSFLARREYVVQTREREEFYNMFPFGDMPFLLWCLLHGDGYFIDSIDSCYRVLSGGYNSHILSCPDIAIKQKEKLIGAMHYLDDYTSKKYHHEISYTILRFEFGIECLKGNSFVILMPKFWPVISHKAPKEKVTYLIKTLFPSIYRKVKELQNKRYQVNCVL